MNEALRTSVAHVFVSPADLVLDGTVPISPDTEHHLSRVLRLRGGESVSVSDGEGRWREAVVVSGNGALRLEPVGDVIAANTQRPAVTLATAMPKGDRLDWLVQKCTEIGVGTIQLLHAERSVVRWNEDKTVKQLPRLQRISDEASRQSRRLRRVQLLAPVDARLVLPAAVVADPQGRPLAPGDTQIAIGPEGGWTPGELELASDTIVLGPNILRTETAAVVAIALSVAAS